MTLQIGLVAHPIGLEEASYIKFIWHEFTEDMPLKKLKFYLEN